MLPLFRAVAKFCSTNRLFTYSYFANGKFVFIKWPSAIPPCKYSSRCFSSSRTPSAYATVFHSHINLFLHKSPFSKTNINKTIHHNHNGLATITKTKIKTHPGRSSRGSCLIYCKLIKYIFSCFLKRQSVGSSLTLKGISFQVLKAEYENPFLAYSRLCLGKRR